MLVVIEDLRFRSDSDYEWITQTVDNKNSSPRACFGAVLCRHNIINYRCDPRKNNVEKVSDGFVWSFLAL
jgi:hypothetical protein